MNYSKLPKFLLFALAIALMATIVGCTPEAEAPEENIADRVLTVIQGVDATTLDPAMQSETPTQNVLLQMFDTVVNQTADAQIEPHLATSWEMVDNTTWNFTLRDDVYFHDGEQLTSADVKYTIERILDPENKSSQFSNYSAISEVVIQDDFNFTLKTENPYPLLLVRLADLHVVPMHYVEEVGNGEFGLNPMGSGPYILNAWAKDEYVKLDANEEYWNGSPEVKHVIFKPVPESSARVMALQSGEADLIVNLPPHEVAGLEANENTSVAEVPSTRFIFLVITMDNEPVQDIRIRQALNYAVNVPSIIDNIFEGKGVHSSQPLCSFDLGYDDELEPYEYNPELAMQLLAEAGYTQDMELEMSSCNGRYSMDKEVAEAVAQQLNEAGFNVNLQFKEWGTYATNLLQGLEDSDFWLIGWGSSTFDAGTTLNFWLNSTLASSYINVSEEDHAMLDSLLNEGLNTMDPVAREAIYKQIVKYVYDNALFVPLYQQVDLYGISNRIEWAARSDEAIRVVDVSWK